MIKCGRNTHLSLIFFNCDETTLKTIIRSNPGVVYLEKGRLFRNGHFVRCQKVSKKIILINDCSWKLEIEYHLIEGLNLASRIEDSISKLGPMEVRVIAAAPYTHLDRMVNSTDRIDVFAQDVSRHESGAFTGEVSAGMLKSIGVKGSIVGHSERRAYHGENDELIHEKIQMCLQHDLEVIYCCGEQLEDRKNGHTMKVIERQISKALSKLNVDPV